MKTRRRNLLKGLVYVAVVAVTSSAIAAGAHLEIAPAGAAGSDAALGVRPTSQENVTVFCEPGRYGGWPANHGIWQWGDELVVGFTSTWYKHATHDHAIDRSKPSYEWQARLSSDEGRTWGPEIVLRDDGLTGDLGYPRSIVRPDGRVLTVYYFNGPRDEDRTIQGTLWMPPAP